MNLGSNHRLNLIRLPCLFLVEGFLHFWPPLYIKASPRAELPASKEMFRKRVHPCADDSNPNEISAALWELIQVVASNHGWSI